MALYATPLNHNKKDKPKKTPVLALHATPLLHHNKKDKP